MTAIRVVTDSTTRAELEEAITGHRETLRRMPTHWVERRARIDGLIDAMLEDWVAAGGSNCRTCGRTKAVCDAEPRACCAVCEANGHGS